MTEERRGGAFPTNSDVPECDVIVVGAGPTGLMLASELALAGVGVHVLERLSTPTGQSKALNLQPRTAEVFDLRGLGERALAAAHGTWGGGHFGGRPLRFTGWRTRHPYQVNIPQAAVERMLTERLAEQGVPILRGHDLTALAQDEAGVTVTVRAPSGQHRRRARFLVGCDGGRSTVRRQLGVSFPGTEASLFAFVADVVFAVVPPSVPATPRSVLDVVTREGGPGRAGGGLLPLGDTGRHRFTFTDPHGRPADPASPVSAAEISTALRRLYGDDGELAEVCWASRFTNATRQVERYRVGRVLLAGDAAHIHYPAGGQGLGLGVQDAMNLGWKLAATVRGSAPDGLLDSYHGERHPVGARVLDNTRAQSLPPDPAPETLAMHQLITDLAGLPEVQRHLAGMVSGLDVRYPADGPHPLPGARLPDLDLTVGGHGTRASALFHTGHGVLLSTDPRYAAHPWSDRVDTVRVPALPGLDADAVLVRPDGYVCWAAPAQAPTTAPTPHGPGAPDLETALRTWFGGPRSTGDLRSRACAMP